MMNLGTGGSEVGDQLGRLSVSPLKITLVSSWRCGSVVEYLLHSCMALGWEGRRERDLCPDLPALLLARCDSRGCHHWDGCPPSSLVEKPIPSRPSLWVVCRFGKQTKPLGKRTWSYLYELISRCQSSTVVWPGHLGSSSVLQTASSLLPFATSWSGSRPHRVIWILSSFWCLWSSHTVDLCQVGHTPSISRQAPDAPRPSGIPVELRAQPLHSSIPVEKKSTRGSEWPYPNCGKQWGEASYLAIL